MAIYHCSIKIISRNKGRSAVGASAYRSGEILTNEYDGITHDYTKKRGIVHTEILIPSHAPPEFSDRSILWNSVEKIEKAKNSQLAREIEIALPAELDREAQIQMVRDYVRDNFVSAGMCADFAVHDKEDGNPHAHIMLTMRPLEQSGKWGAKSQKEYILDEQGQRIKLKNGTFKSRKVDTVDWNNQEKAEIWRKAWADTVNRYLAKQEIAECVDHRSYKRQNIEKLPTVHLGVAVIQMERRGISTDKVKHNLQIAKQNHILEEIKKRLGKLLRWIKEKKSHVPAVEPAPPQSVLERLERAKKEVADREAGKQKRAFNSAEINVQGKAFLQEQNIASYPELIRYIRDLRERHKTVNEKAGRMQILLDEKRERLKQSEIYLKYKEYYNACVQASPERRADYYQEHRKELILYKQAQEYLGRNLQGKSTLKPKTWRAELEELTQKRDSLSRTAEMLEEKLSEAETVRREAEKAMLKTQSKTKNNDLTL